MPDVSKSRSGNTQHDATEARIEPLPEDSSSSSSNPGAHRHYYPRPPTPPFLSGRTTSQTKRDDATKKDETSVPKFDWRGHLQLLSQLEEDSKRKKHHRSASASRTKREKESTLSLLLDQLLSQTARANLAERELADTKDAAIKAAIQWRESRDKLELELVQVKLELSLYKNKYNEAREEINRAQEAVRKLEAALSEADDRSARDRAKARQVLEERAIEAAREQGHREGWRQGLERGRWYAWMASEYADEDMYEEEEDYLRPRHTTSSGSHGSTRTQRSTSTRRSPTSSRPRPRDGSGSNNRSESHNRDAPVVPSTQEPLPVTPPRRPETTTIPSGTQEHRETRSRSDSRTQPPRTQTNSPAPSLTPSRLSQKSTVIPPDNYIPSMGADSRISLPPPHELVQPVEYGASASDSGQRRTNVAVGGGLGQIPNSHSDVNRGVKDKMKAPVPVTNYRTGGGSADYGSYSRARVGNNGWQEPYSRAPSAMSMTSRSSYKSISEFDLLKSPPNRRNRSATSPIPMNVMQYSSAPVSGGTQPERIAEEWRSANTESQSSATIAPSYLHRKAESWDANSIYSAAKSGNRSQGTSSRPSTARPKTPSDRYPRKEIREFALPVPLSSMSVSGTSGKIPIYSNPSPLLQRDSGDNGPGQTTPEHLSENTGSGSTSQALKIDVESPSTVSSSSVHTIDPVMLSPDAASGPARLPNVDVLREQNRSTTPTQSLTKSNPKVISVDNLPPGFVALSPIPYTMNALPSHNNQSGNPTHPYPIYSASSHPGGSTGTPESSTLFQEPTRPSTAIGSNSSKQKWLSNNSESSRRRVFSFGTSPAPLNRPLSILSNSD